MDQQEKTRLMQKALAEVDKEAEERVEPMYRRAFLRTLIGASFGAAAMTSRRAEAYFCLYSLKPKCTKCDVVVNTCPQNYACVNFNVCANTNNCTNGNSCTGGNWCTNLNTCVGTIQCTPYNICT